MAKAKRKVGAIVLAAGISSRMGQPKLVLPWRESTIIGHVVKILEMAKLDEIIVVTGGSRNLVEEALHGYHTRTIFNPAYEYGEMLSSVQRGLKCLSSGIEAALITLGDQPFIQFQVVRSILDAYQSEGKKLIVPSYKNRRGHPWLVDKSLWNEILIIDSKHSLRDFINSQQTKITYIEVNTDSILLDLDTMDDYLEHMPGNCV